MPFINQLHVSRPLTNVSVKYRNAELIGMEVFPVVPVVNRNDSYFIFTPDFRIPQTLRANKGLAQEHYWELSTAAYQLQIHALKEYISDEDKENYDPGGLEVDTVEELTDKILMRHELRVAQLFTTTSFSLNVSLAATGAWNSNSTVSDPVPVIATGATEIIGNSGRRPNYMILPRDGYVAFQNHTSVLDRTKYTGVGVSDAIIASLSGVEKVYQPIAQYDSSARGAASVMTSIFNNDICFLGWKPARPAPRTPSVGYSFMRTGSQVVSRWREEERNADGIKVEMQADPRVVSSLCGFLIKDTV